MTTDAPIYKTIQQLVDEEHSIRTVGGARVGDRTGQAQRLRELETQLDQCWDLLRRRRALRTTGSDPETASVRPAGVVQRYLQ